jgi:hypothetical protein
MLLKKSPQRICRIGRRNNRIVGTSFHANDRRRGDRIEVWGAAAHGRLWHFCDLPGRTANVRYWGEIGLNADIAVGPFLTDTVEKVSKKKLWNWILK